MKRTFLLRLLLLCVSTLLACGDSPITELLVTLESNIARDKMDQIEIESFDLETGERADSHRFILGKRDRLAGGRAELPLSFRMKKNKADRFLLVVTGLKGDEAVVRQRIIAHYTAKQTVGLSVFLAKVCLDELCGDRNDLVCYPMARAGVDAGACGPLEPSTDYEPENEEDLGSDTDRGMRGGADTTDMDGGKAVSTMQDGAPDEEPNAEACETGFAGPDCKPVLNALWLSRGKLSPAFDEEVEEYQAVVASWQQIVGVSARIYPGHSLQVEGEEAPQAEEIVVPLEVGENTLDIRVVAGGETRTYRVVVTRKQLKEHYLKAPAPSILGGFGRSVSLNKDGDVLAVSAKEGCYLFGRGDGRWRAHASAPLPGLQFVLNGEGNAVLGLAAASDGTYWLAQTWSGSIDGTWTLDPSGLDLSEHRYALWPEGATAISQDGRTAAIGVPAAADGRGVAVLFERQRDEWRKVHSNAPGDFHDVMSGGSDGLRTWGAAVALSASGDVFAFSAPAQDDGSGGVYVYRRRDGAWSGVRHLLPGNAGSSFGNTIDLSADGTTLLVGAPGDFNGQGSVYMYGFDVTTQGWFGQHVFRNSDIGAGFGTATALSDDGNTVVIGAGAQDTHAGSVYVYVKAGDLWSAPSGIVASNRDREDLFGFSNLEIWTNAWVDTYGLSSVGISGDGSTLAVAARAEASCYVDDRESNGCTHAGAVYVFE